MSAACLLVGRAPDSLHADASLTMANATPSQLKADKQVEEFWATIIMAIRCSIVELILVLLSTISSLVAMISEIPHSVASYARRGKKRDRAGNRARPLSRHCPLLQALG